MGVVGALVEIEYMNLIRETLNPELIFYHLGELNVKCSKVNYKLNYSPGGLVMCPQTRQWVEYEGLVAKKIDAISKLTIE